MVDGKKTAPNPQSYPPQVPRGTSAGVGESPPSPPLLTPRGTLTGDELLPPAQIPVSPSTSKTSSITGRARELLSLLETLESIYLCHIDTPFPDTVASKIGQRCVRRYELKDYYGVTRFYAAELTKWCNYWFCSDARNFLIHVYDLTGELVFEATRMCSTSLCACGVDCCCISGVETAVTFNNRVTFIGNVVSSTNCVTPKYTVNNEWWEEIFLINGPQAGLICPCKLCCAKEFTIRIAKTEVPVGKIIYGYDGLQEATIPNPKTIGVIFPPRCNVEGKACLLTAGFMLDVTYYQQRGFTIHRLFRFLLNLLLVIGFVVLCSIVYIITGKDQE